MLPVLRQNNTWPDRLSMSGDWLDREFGRLVRNVFSDGASEAATTAKYPVNIWEDDEAVHIEAELPGFTKDEVNVTIEQGTLHIAAQHDHEQQQRNGSPVLTERTWSRYYRSFSLPTAVQEDNVSATCEHGILSLTLPKRPEVKPRRIQVK